MLFLNLITSLWRHEFYIPTLAVGITAGTIALTIGRPVLESETIHLPYSETMQFRYPITSTLYQFLFSTVCIFLAALLVRRFDRQVKNISYTPLKASSALHVAEIGQHEEADDRVHGRLRLLGSWHELLTAVPFALAITVEVALTSTVLHFAPLEVFCFSRAFVLPASLLLKRFFCGQDGATDSLHSELPSLLLSVSVALASYQSRIACPVRIAVFAFVLAISSAFWPFLARRSPKTRLISARRYSKVGMIVVESPTDTESTQSGMDWRSAMQLLLHTSFLVTCMLLVITMVSGELGRIWRNCYFLDETPFWVYMNMRGVSRLTLFCCSVLMVQGTSVTFATFFFVLINVSSMSWLTFSSPDHYQLVGLIGCIISTLLYVWVLSNKHSSASTGLPFFTVRWEGKGPSTRQKGCYAFMLIFVVLGLFALSQKPFGAKPSPPEKEVGIVPSLPFVQGDDAYLGKRASPDTYADISMLVEKCRGSYETQELVPDVARCLTYLADHEEEYYTTPSPASDVSTRDIDEISSLETDLTQSGSVETCIGRIIPYHIWWTGTPFWRIELFIKSYFHTQNLACSRLYIWVNAEQYPEALGAWLSHPLFAKFLPFVNSGDIIVKEWTIPERVPLSSDVDELDKARYYSNPSPPNARGEQLVADSVVRDADGQEWVIINEDGNQIRQFVVASSDAARLIILHLYGGVYMDIDLILLRDLRPLLLSDIPFAERWGAKKPHALYNNALVAMPAKTSFSSYLLRGGARMGLTFHFMALGRMLVKEGRDGKDDKGLLKLETAAFDPIWTELDHNREGECTLPCFTAVEQVFQNTVGDQEWSSFKGEQFDQEGNNRTMENFFPGSWAYHIHNQWKAQYEPGSWIDAICQTHDAFFDGTKTNPYGEMWTRPRLTNYGT